MSKDKPKSFPYVYVDIDARTDGTNTPVAVHAHCSLYSQEWPSKCPWFRSLVEPPQAGETCAFYDCGDCHCKAMMLAAMQKFREFIDECEATAGGEE